MTLDEAIKHAEEVADKKDCEKQKWERWLENDSDYRAVAEKVSCELCAEEHRQLAEWLKDYKRLLEQEPMLDKIKAEIEALPKTYPFVNHIDMYVKEDDVRKIIDKYKVESDNENDDYYRGAQEE